MINKFIQLIISKIISNPNHSKFEYLEPKGDPGLFGPNSLTWIVHKDFISMMIGGISSLILQSLHPRAMAGIWDHSSFRTDINGRLARTAEFIARTTYGPLEMADKTIEKIKKIHEVVKGNDQFGNSYYANDPYLLNWVHMTESICFLNANQLFTDNKFNFNQKNQYYSEMSLIAKKFGINEPVETENDINKQIDKYQKDLIFTDRSQVVMELIMNFPCHFTIKPIYKAFSQAAIINLPDWAFTFLPIKKPPFIKRKIIIKSVKTISVPVRNALKEGIAFQAKKRMNIV